MKFDIEKLDKILGDRYENEWGNALITGEFYDYPALPINYKIPLTKLLQGKFRLLFNACPNKKAEG